MLILDGSHGEGGGQILRSALTLAVFTGMPVRLEHVRAGRSRPGLRPQHLTAVQATAQICDAEVEGAVLGSQTLDFRPGGPARSGSYSFDVTEAAPGGSAGAVTLILQTVLLPLALAAGSSTVVLRGGTTVPWSPSALYLEQVYLPVLARLGAHAAVTGHRWGFYPQGGGELVVEIGGNATLEVPVPWERGPLREVTGSAYVSRLPSHIPQRMTNRAHSILAKAGLSVHLTPEHVTGRDTAAGLFLVAHYENVHAGFSVLGRKGLPSEVVAEQTCEDLLAYHRSGAVLEPHLADQMILPLALAGTPLRVTVSQVTRHLLTNAWIVAQFLPGVLRVEGEEDGPGALIVGKPPGIAA